MGLEASRVVWDPFLAPAQDSSRLLYLATSGFSLKKKKKKKGYCFLPILSSLLCYHSQLNSFWNPGTPANSDLPQVFQTSSSS